MKTESMVCPAPPLRMAGIGPFPAAGLALMLLGRVRDAGRRRKNLAELRALDAGRLDDIGLSEEARARLLERDAFGLANLPRP